MIDELEDRVLEFGGRSTHTHCFLHAVNLVAKSLVHEFDVNKKWRHGEHTGSLDKDAERLEQELRTLADGIELEEWATVDENGLDGNDELEGWINEVERLTKEEREEFHETVRPVKLALVKVKHIKNKQIYLLLTCILGDLATGLQDHALHHEVAPRMATNLGGTEAKGYQLATRCCHTLEFHLRYVGLCADPSTGCGHNDPVQGNGFACVQADRRRIGCPGGVARCSKGMYIPRQVHVGINNCCRYSRMPRTSFPARHPAWRTSFQQWTSSTRNSQCTHSTANTHPQFVLQFLSQSAHATGTTSLRMAPTLIGLQWVSIGHPSHQFLTDILLYLSVLHPCHKLTYFLKAKWESEWISTTQELVQDEFRRNYESIEIVEEVTNDNNNGIQLVCSVPTIFKC
jgi:hypothetical protein